MNTFKHIVIVVIWSAVAFFSLLMALTHIPPCQQWLGEKVAVALSQKLGTAVTLERIDLGLLNRLVIDGVQIVDQQRKPMFRVGRMSVKVDYLPLLKGRIVITSAQLFNAHASLYRENAASPLNFQFVLDSLASRDTTSHAPLNLAVNSFIIRRSGVVYDEFDAPETPGILNSKHLKINDVSAHILLKTLTEDSLYLNVKRLAFKEHSGLVLSRMSMLLTRHYDRVRLQDFFLQLPRSSMSIDKIEVTVDIDHPEQTLRYQGAISDLSITPTDFAFLSSGLSRLKTPVNVVATFNGTARGIEVEQFSMTSGDGNLLLNADGWVHDWNETPSWQVSLRRMQATTEFFSMMREQGNDIPQPIERMGNVAIKAEASGYGDGVVDMNCHIASGVGHVNFIGNISRDKMFSGHLVTDSLQLGHLLDDKHFGLLATQIDIRGKANDLKARGQVSRFEYNDYVYHDINLDGTYKHGDFSGKLEVSDPNLTTTINGQFLDRKPYVVRLTADVDKLAPKVLNLSDQWGDACFSTTINADFTATTLNDANGTLDVEDFLMRDSTLLYGFDNLHVSSGYEGDVHYLKLKGDMGEAELNGHFDWATLPQTFISYVASKLPTLPGLPKKVDAADNEFEIRLHLQDTYWMRHLLNIHLELLQPLQLQALVSDKQHIINVKGRMPEFEFNEGHYEAGNIDITSPGDSMICEISATRISQNERLMDFGLHAFAADNNLYTSFSWDNHQAETILQGELNARTSLYVNEAGLSEAKVSILPSKAKVGEAQWEVQPGEIIYNAEKVAIDHLAIAHDLQHIIVEGVASAQPEDSVIVDLNSIEVAYILDLVGFTSVSFSGQATGKAVVSHALDAPDAHADLLVRHFEFEGGRMGILNAHADWNKTEKQIDIHAIADDGPEAMTYIDGFVSPSRDCIDLAIKGRGTYIDFLHTYSASFLDHVTGHATGDVRLVGPLGAMDLLGTLVVDAQATVTALGTTYQLHQDTVVFVHNDILLQDNTATDRFGNQALVNGGIHHENLSNLTFDLDIKTDKLLAYDLPETLIEPFYGTVIASGDVSLKGLPGEVRINCNATPLPGTVFTYNAANPEAISDQRFITWGTKTPDATPTAPEATVGGTSGASSTSSVPSDLRINFLVNTTPDATLRLLMDSKTNDYITLCGSGVIRATYHNNGAFQMFGTYTVEKGTYGITIQNIIKKNFTFNPGGTLVFGGAPFDANLNLQAVYTVNGVSLSDLSIGNSFTGNTVRVNCLMNISGQAGAPQVEFDLDMPTVNSEEKQMIRSVITSEQEMNQQVLYLLGIGRFYTQGANNASSQQQYGQSELAMQSFLSGTLSTQINEVLSQVLKTNNWNFGANISTGNEGWHNAEYEGVVSGSMLNNRLLINGQFGYRDNATKATPSFIGDFDIRYLLQPNGNLALKMYNQTNDRYFTHSSLNTQGIGLILKRDFNGLLNFFGRKKKENHVGDDAH